MYFCLMLLFVWSPFKLVHVFVYVGKVVPEK